MVYFVRLSSEDFDIYLIALMKTAVCGLLYWGKIVTLHESVLLSSNTRLSTCGYVFSPLPLCYSLHVDGQPTACGRGYHKKRKKGARSRFDRHKNDERRHQQENKENSGTLTSQPTKSDDNSLSLPQLWQKVTGCWKHSVL